MNRGDRKRIIREATRQRIRLERERLNALSLEHRIPLSRFRHSEDVNLHFFKDVPNVMAIAHGLAKARHLSW